MSTDSKGTDGAANETANGVDSDKETVTETPNKDVVAYDTYRKTLSLAKKREAELDIMRGEKQALLDEKMAAEGKQTELIESLKKQVQDRDGKLKKVVGSFGYKTLSQALALEAAKEGCVNIGDLIALSDLSTVEMDDEFNVNQDQVKEMIQRSKKERGYLFNKSAVNVKTGIPTNNTAAKDDDWKKLPLIKQAELALQKLKNNN